MIKTKIETITPKRATTIMETNTRNRPLNKKLVKKYAEIMLQGDWKDLTGDTIKIDRDGYVLDGQHRLAACIASGADFKSIVVTGLDPEVFDVLDHNRGRGFNDTLAIRGKKHYTLMASTSRVLYSYDHLIFRMKQVTTDSQLTLTLKRWNGLVDVDEWVHYAASTYREFIPGSLVAGCGCIFERQTNHRQARAFFDKVTTGVGLRKTDHAVLALRSKLEYNVKHRIPWRRIDLIAALFVVYKLGRKKITKIEIPDINSDWYLFPNDKIHTNPKQ